MASMCPTNGLGARTARFCGGYRTELKLTTSQATCTGAPVVFASHWSLGGLREPFDPHPALRATLSQRERDNPEGNPSPSGRGWREAPGEGRRLYEAFSSVPRKMIIATVK